MADPIVAACAALSVVISLVALGRSFSATRAAQRSASAAEDSAAAAAQQAESARASVDLAQEALDTSRSMFKRQGVIDLHHAWVGVDMIDPQEPITPDVVRAVGALELTASLWLHDVIEKEILFQSYWQSYQTLYDQLASCSTEVLGLRRTGRELLTPPVHKAYHEMSNRAAPSSTISDK